MNKINSHKQLVNHPFLSISGITLTRGEGVYLWDAEGKRYIDFTSTGINQGHCHPTISEVFKKQVATLTVTTRAFYSEPLEEFSLYITKLFKYDKVFITNSGEEACETAVKIARKWGYVSKKIPEKQAKVVFAESHLWGQSLAAISACSNSALKENVGPYLPGFVTIPYDDLSALEKVLEVDSNICAFMVEPIQVKNGVVIPSKGYLKGVRELCTKYNVLWIDDEVQAGLGRAGKLLTVEYENVRPDMVCLGKSLSGGITPMSVILGDDTVMFPIFMYENVSTYGENPLGCKVAMAAIKVIIEERLAENALRLEPLLRKELERLPKTIVKEVRGKGLIFAVVLNDGMDFTAIDVCVKLSNNGILTENNGCDIIRLAPPLVITDAELIESTNIVFSTFNSFCK